MQNARMHSDSASPAHDRTLQLPQQHPTPPKKRRDGMKVAFFVILGILIVALGVAGVYMWSVWNSFSSQATVIDDAFPDGDRPAGIEGAQTILLLGSDSRGSGEESLTGLADTIMVAHIPADAESVQVMSIMRDNWVEIPGHGENKINAAMAFGGIPLMVQTVESFLDTRVDRVAVLNFESFQGLTEAVGGITVNNPTAFTAVSGERFEEGDITLQGSEALAFVRERKAFPTGDYQRAANQQLFLKGLMSEILSAQTLTNPFRVASLVDEVSPHLMVDAEFGPLSAARLGFSMRDIRSGDVRFFTSPTLGTGTVGGQSIVRPDWDGIAEIREHIKAGTLADYEPSGR